MPKELDVVVPADHTWVREASLGSSQPMVVRYPLCPMVVAVGDFVDQHFGYGAMDRERQQMGVPTRMMRPYGPKNPGDSWHHCQV